MTLIILLIPIVVAIFLFFFFKKNTTWWEYCLLIGPSIFLFLILKYSIISYEESDIEYLGNYITKVTYYQPWNEYIHRTCTRTCGSGKHTYTVSYDCSYVDEHPEQFAYTLNTGEEEMTTAEDFNNIKCHWHSKAIFRDLDRDYYTKDGDAFDTKWDGNKMTCKTRTFQENYTNKVRASHSIFKFEDISKAKAKKLGLYDYPERETDYAQQEQVLGLKKKDRAGVQMINYINGIYGFKKQFRTYILMFYNKSITIAQNQREYWEGGNKNEFIVCIGVDSITNKIQWSYPFSWQDTPLLEAKTKQFLIPDSKFSLYKYSCWLDNNISRNWKRKNFDTFDYLNVDLSDKQYLFLLIMIAFYDIAISVYIIRNGYNFN